MSVTVIPTALAQGAAIAATRNPRNAGTCGMHEIAGRLGQAHRPVGYLVRLLDGLIADEGFPAPFPVHSAGRLVKGAHRDSTWPRVAVDLWFDDRLPPAARGLLDQADRVALDSRLSARAATLFTGDAA